MAHSYAHNGVLGGKAPSRPEIGRQHEAQRDIIKANARNKKEKGRKVCGNHWQQSLAMCVLMSVRSHVVRPLRRRDVIRPPCLQWCHLASLD